MKMESIALLADLTARINISITDTQLQQFNLFGDLLIERNNNINLTAIKDEKDIILKHFIDSLSIIKYIKSYVSSLPMSDPLRKPSYKYIDVGAGAGFPGLPVKIIMKDELDAVLIESISKKANFIKDVINALELTRVKAENIRAEDAGRGKRYRGTADVASARAVAALPVLLEYCTPLLKQGGVFLAMKSANETVETEIHDSERVADILGCKIETADHFCLPDSDIKRRIIAVRKVRETPAKYPRKAGVPSKIPLREESGHNAGKFSKK